MRHDVPAAGGDRPQPSPAGIAAERQILIEQLSDRYSPAGIRKRQLQRRFQSNAWLVWVQVLSGARRGLDLLLTLITVIALFPFFPFLYVFAKLQGGGIARTARLGRWGCTYQELAFTHGPFRAMPALINILKGDMSLIGPRPVSPDDVLASERLAWRRFNIRPGLICLWWIRQRTNIAYGSEFEADSEYLDSQSLWGDVALGLRAIPAAFYGDGISFAPEKIDFLGIPIDNVTMDEAIDRILQTADGEMPAQVCFVNADCVNISYRDLEYKGILQTANMVLADGIGVKLAGKILNTNIRQNVNGTDLFPLLCARMEEQRMGLYLLGGKPGVAQDVAEWVAAHYPNLPLSGHRHGFFQAAEASSVAQEIRNSGASIVLIAFGVPKQEKWIREQLPLLGSKLAIGVGGLFDFYSGRISRAPIWVRELGMEWFYRFLQEPQRMWRRYFLGNAVFLTRVILHRLAANRAKKGVPA